MKPLLLIAANYVREQRWPALGLTLYAVGNAVLFAYLDGGIVRSEEVYFYVRQQSLFVCIFGLFLMSSAIYNDRRSRRILAVLSKAITRAEYLGALLFGVMCVTTIYSVVVLGCAGWLCRRAEIPVTPVASALALAWVAALATAAVTLFFSTMLHPLFASSASAAVIGMAAAWPHLPPNVGAAISPVYHLLQNTMSAPTLRADAPLQAVAFAVVHTVVFFVLACVVFSQRDVAVAID